MTTEPNRRRFVGLIGGAVSVAAAGCLGNSSGSPGQGGTVSESEISDEAARTRALNAENRYIRDQLRDTTCLDDWGTESYVVTPEASISERTEDGVIVNVTQGWWHSRTWTEEGSNKTQSVEADGATNAQYLVTPDDSERLSGDDVSPC